MDAEFYLAKLYPLQDRVLEFTRSAETGFYLSGGTAASRGYLNHRFSDDLDLFVNDRPEFGLWADRIIAALTGATDLRVRVLLRDERFRRLVVSGEEIELKVELINDTPAFIGAVQDHPQLGRLDSRENLLANKVTAVLDRREPKDLADIWGFCVLGGLSLVDALDNASGKAAGVFPADLARALLSATKEDFQLIRWIHPPGEARFLADLEKLGEALIL
jgi:hypothetical protein